ncbi:MAG: hypothetical protein Q8N94_07300 [Methanoregula sp.]|nr:hypothetical protein [Methanoregula sp.]
MASCRWGITIIGLIISVIFKKYTLFGYPLSETPGCWILAAIVLGVIVIVEILIGLVSLLDGIFIGIGMVIVLTALELVNLLEKSRDKPA